MPFESAISSLNLDSSIFNKQSYADALNGPYSIWIVPEARTSGSMTKAIIGVLKNNVSFSINADYGTLNLGSVVSNFPKIEELTRMLPLAPGGISVANAGISTRKYYLRSGYLELSPEFRVVDWEGNGAPITQALFLTALCLPEKTSESVSINELIDKLNEEATNRVEGQTIINGGKELYEQVRDIGIGVGTFIGNTVNKVSPTVGAGSQKGLSEIMNGEFLLTSSPQTVQLKLGNYFDRGNMIVESVSCNFSKEVTDSGPMWADFSIKISSQEALTLDKDEQYPLGFASKTSRFVEY